MTSQSRNKRYVPWRIRIAVSVIAVYVLVALFAPLLAPYGQTEIVGRQFMGWSSHYLLGTDNLGRDVASRLIWGARNSVGIALVTTLLTFFIGVVFGLLAAALGGWIDYILSRIVDVIMAIPSLIASLMMLTIFGTSVLTLVLVIAVLESTRVFRLARAVALGVVVQDYFIVAKMRKEPALYLIREEILPNVLPPLAVEFGLRFCFVFLFISALSFLGLGLQPPLADWGSMVRENAMMISFLIFTPLIPAAAIAVLTIAINSVMDWVLDRSRQSRL
ncbi:peptide/nickel transport system permease protein [Mesorhizobium robiniae]|uniref:Peptide/nickel transport system permease protein n=1 Tax=Mesorhizobium robiniae TaxID=559315 RepID=A0ABV2H0N3_9HYPH|nr:ABC transporter permease [Mesorhizobium sp. ZC-5]MCV3244115.1 ABC transporter permease [Mesorhizobium sp. ZC-5]